MVIKNLKIARKIDNVHEIFLELEKLGYSVSEYHAKLSVSCRNKSKGYR